MAGEAALKGPQVVIEAEGEAHTLGAALDGGPARRLEAQANRARKGPDACLDRFVADVQESLERAVGRRRIVPSRPAEGNR
jgi:hypothetical protein